jgi:hypothetical protein
MIKRNQLKASFSFVFGILLISIFTSCVTSKNVPPGQMSKIPSWKNLYYFHAGDSTWIVKPVAVAGNQFAGIIYKPELIKKQRQVHIYAEPLSAVRIENNQLSIPMDKITKVENYRINAGMIIGSIGFVALLFLIPVLL